MRPLADVGSYWALAWRLIEVESSWGIIISTSGFHLRVTVPTINPIGTLSLDCAPSCKNALTSSLY